MATPFTATLALSNGESLTMSGDDVTTNKMTAPSGSTAPILSASEDVIIKDVSISVVGTTTYLQLYVNGQLTNTRIYKAANLPTANGRQIQISPIRIKKGSFIELVQVT